jgi:hypothetical protein
MPTDPNDPLAKQNIKGRLARPFFCEPVDWFFVAVFCHAAFFGFMPADDFIGLR